MENPDLPRWHDVPLDEETENLLSSIILLEEFCKEIAAITVVKFEMAEKILKQQQHRMAVQQPQNNKFTQNARGKNRQQMQQRNLANNSDLGNGNLGLGGGTILVADGDQIQGL